MPPLHSDCLSPGAYRIPSQFSAVHLLNLWAVCLDPMSGLSPVFLWEDPCTFRSKWEWRVQCQEDEIKRNRRKRAIEKLLLKKKKRKIAFNNHPLCAKRCARHGAVSLQVLPTISYNSSITPCVQGMKLLKQECGSKPHPSPSSPSNTGFSALRLSLSLHFGFKEWWLGWPTPICDVSNSNLLLIKLEHQSNPLKCWKMKLTNEAKKLQLQCLEKKPEFGFHSLPWPCDLEKHRPSLSSLSTILCLCSAAQKSKALLM